ncbi:hypothetical protein [Streptomyces sp. NPDC048606]|uniref:hypothetical protein n=1 Tax=Streptomyces sp. NPDC048606 TaxID=3154726 RepID=UPI00343A5A94
MPSEPDRTPQEWRELLRTTYDYPEETTLGRRKERRRARRTHRQAARKATADSIRRQRRKEPITAGGAVLVVAVVLALGLSARLGTDWIRGEQSTPTAAKKPSAPPATDDAKPPGITGAAPALSPSESPSVDLSAPDTVAGEFVRQYLTRDPVKDQTHKAAVRRAAPWSTRALAANLEAHEDPAFGRLVSRGGVSRIAALKVEPADRTLPPDTPLRVWRTVTATVDVHGYTDYTESTVIQTEVTRTDGGWRVSGILGV